MKLVKTTDLKKGQMILIGRLESGEFEIAEVRELSVHFKSWERIDMNKGVLTKKGDGIINLQEEKGGVQVLNSSELIEINKMKNKILMLNGLEDKS